MFPTKLSLGNYSITWTRYGCLPRDFLLLCPPVPLLARVLPALAVLPLEPVLLVVQALHAGLGLHAVQELLVELALLEVLELLLVLDHHVALVLLFQQELLLVVVLLLSAQELLSVAALPLKHGNGSAEIVPVHPTRYLTMRRLAIP